MTHSLARVLVLLALVLLGLPAGALAQDALAQDAPADDPPPATPPAGAASTPDVDRSTIPPEPPPSRTLSTDEEVRAQLAALATPGGLTADRAAERALASAPSLDGAEAAVAVSEAGARRAWQALFPRVDVSFRYTRLSPISQPDFGSVGFDEDQLAAARLGVDALEDPTARLLWNGLLDSFGNTEAFSFPVLLNNYALRASMTYPVSDLFFTILPSYEAAQSATEATRARIDIEERTIALRARETFYELARARGAFVVAEKSVEQAESHRQQVAALVDAGAAARVDLLRVQAQLAQARVAVANTRGGVAVAENALRVLMHAEPNEVIQLGEDFSQDVTPLGGDLQRLTERALAARPELVSIDRAITAQTDAIEAQLGRRYPRLLLQANLDYANPNNRIIPQQQEFRATWDISVILSWSPNDLGDARVAVEEARARILEVQGDRRSLEDAVRLEVAQAATGFEAAQAAWEASRMGLHAAEESYRVRFDQLQAGAAVTSDLIDAEAELTRARLEVVDAAIAIRLADARLRAAVGE